MVKSSKQLYIRTACVQERGHTKKVSIDQTNMQRNTINNQMRMSIRDGELNVRNLGLQGAGLYSISSTLHAKPSLSHIVSKVF